MFEVHRPNIEFYIAFTDGAGETKRNRGGIKEVPA